jgi:hypothetical protein
MAKWDASAELMAKIRESLRPVQTDEALRQVLAQDFPRDCSNLPISGGWGYTKDSAIRFRRDLFPNGIASKFVPIEYHIAQKIAYEELIVFRPHNYRFSGIELKLNFQELVDEGEQIYDLLLFDITCWSDWHWNQLAREWEENEFGMRAGFDRDAHDAKREDSKVTFQREFWFDITEVFDG